MGKKYIVEIGRLERLYKAYVNGNGKPNITWLSPEVDLTPYIEPDLEQVRKEAYEEGYDDAKGGYENGFENGMIVAWDVARKIQDTGGNLKWWIHNTTASEAIEKIRQYEQKQKEIKVGDEVLAPFGTAVVTNIVGDKIFFCYADGHGGFDYKKDKPRKTGRHFPEIAAVLEKMRGEQDGERREE